MEGIYFYGFAWSIWIISTFILNKNSSIRLPLATFLLILIIVSPYSVSFKEYTISYVSIFILLIVLFKVGTLSKKSKYYFILTSFILSIGYVTFLLFELFDPVWIIFKREWMLAILLTYLAVLLQRTLYWRISIVLVGCLYGDILFAIAIHPFSFPFDIGSIPYLDVCTLATVMLFGWEGIKLTIGFIENHFNTVEKEKQKTT